VGLAPASARAHRLKTATMRMLEVAILRMLIAEGAPRRRWPTWIRVDLLRLGIADGAQKRRAKPRTARARRNRREHPNRAGEEIQVLNYLRPPARGRASRDKSTPQSAYTHCAGYSDVQSEDRFDDSSRYRQPGSRAACFSQLFSVVDRWLVYGSGSNA
jgi:hypothetical protein